MKPHVVQSSSMLQVEQNFKPTRTREANGVGMDHVAPLETNDEYMDDAIRVKNLPIALREGVRNCTKHPLHKQLSYAKLSQRYKAFITKFQYK